MHAAMRARRDNSMTGTLPAWVGKLPQLEILNMGERVRACAGALQTRPAARGVGVGVGRGARRGWLALENLRGGPPPSPLLDCVGGSGAVSTRPS